MKHNRVFLNALRSSLLIVAGFIAYEFLLELGKEHKLSYHEKKLYKLLLIFILDVLIIYGIYFVFKTEL